MAVQTSNVITIPNLQLDINQLLTIVRQLDENARIKVAQTPVDTQMDDKLSGLIQRLAGKMPADALTLDDIQCEVNAIS